MTAHLIAEDGPHKGLFLNLTKNDEWIIGRDPNTASFVIEDDTVSRRHAHFFNESEGIYLENLSRVNPTLINDERIHGKVLLKPGDKIQIGQTIFLFSEDELPEISLQREGQESEDKEEDFVPKEDAHDTIFEDEEEDFSSPSFLLSETPFILKVISGPNAGAEIRLEKGLSYTMGKDPDSCDIIFQDLSVSRTHACLAISQEGTIELEDLGSKNGILVNGITLTEKQRIQPDDMISLGTTVFLIIDRAAPQETIHSPALPIYEQPEPEPLSEKALPEDLLQNEVQPNDWKKEPIPTKYLVAAASFLTMFLIVFLSFFSLFKSGPVETMRKEPISLIAKALDPFKGIQFSFNPASGKLFLVGHVLTAVEAQEMRFRISEIDFIHSLEDNVVIDESINKTMNDVLSSNPLFRSVAISSILPGKFVVTGYLETNDAMQQLNESLLVNFPSLDRLENQCVVGDMLRAQVQSMLQSSGFVTLSFQYANREILLSGNYSEKKSDDFLALLKQIKAIHGVSGIKNYALAVSHNAAAIDISQQFQVSGSALYDSKGYNAIINGKIYAVGDTLSEMTITEIDSTMILLEKDEIRYRINYTR